jgi:hypothetical protein
LQAQQYYTNSIPFQAVLPIIREQKSGIIVNICSGNGRIGFAGASVHVSTKELYHFEGGSSMLVVRNGAPLKREIGSNCH